jgi:bifunctional DNase/RNase
MKVGGLTLDPLTNSPVLVLKGLKGEKILPIWIGVLEATAIATVLENVDVGRPMTHDLLKTLIAELGARILRVEICDLKMNTYYALIHLEQSGQCIQIDARPSDAIALAVRFDAPIFVEEKVLEKSLFESEEGTGQKRASKIIAKADRENLKRILEKLKPEDFGKYKM